ncbi:hypothetical protein ACQP1G_17100 [Nocardia sp. CA-107356]|uniref:hypothetical protein n=1 Tax=Nocardia sp. CA-107356 TaxID=3239972 RepID=UPI003D93D387
MADDTVNWAAAMEQVADEHASAVRRIRYQVEQIDTDARQRSQDLADRERESIRADKRGQLGPPTARNREPRTHTPQGPMSSRTTRPGF